MADVTSQREVSSPAANVEGMGLSFMRPAHDERQNPGGKTISRRTGLKVAGVAGGLMAAGAALGPALRASAESTPVASSPPAALPGTDPQNQEVLDALASFQAPALETVTPDVGRNLPAPRDAVLKILSDRGKPALEAVGGIEHLLIPVKGSDDILARIYRPVAAAKDLSPVLVYFHGGGFVIADLNTYDASCRALANATGSIVASIAYRLAPEHPFPAAVDDAYAATQYFLSGAGVVGGDPKKVAVVGESAGGNLATVVCLRAKEEKGLMPVHQVLVYPVATFAPEGESTKSIKEYAEAKPLNSAQLDWFTKHYLPKSTDASNPHVSPLKASDLSGLPPATIIQAEHDPLQSQGTVYADKLKAAGVDVTVHLYKGTTHEFFGLGAVVDKAKEAVDQVATELKAAFK